MKTLALFELRPASALMLATLLALASGLGCVDLARPPMVDGTGGVTALGGDGGQASGGAGGGGDEPDALGSDTDEEEAGGSGGIGLGGMTGAGGVGGNGGMLSVGGAGGTSGAGGSGGNPVPDAMPDLPPDAPPKFSLGTACTAGSQCTSGFCADGVCCDSACTGVCRTCAAGAGVCRAAAGGTDPRNSCPDDGASTCGRTGVCDGNGACQKYAANTVCSPLSCTGGQIGISRCDGAGACVASTQDCAPYACTSAGSCRTSCASKADCTGYADCFSGICGGIVGTYFASPDFTGRSVTRTDREVNFNWIMGSPAPTIPVDQFSIRWNATLTPRYSEVTTFYVVSDDGVRLWVDGQLIINDFRAHGVEEVSGSISLRARKPVQIRLEYFDDTSDASVVLSWASASQARQVIPVSVLTP